MLVGLTSKSRPFRTAYATSRSVSAIPVTAASPASGRAAAGSPRTGLVHREPTILKVVTVERLNRGVSLFVVIHLDETEAAGSARSRGR